MKKHWKLPAVILMLSCMLLSASAQETKSDKKLKIEFGIGMNFSGPQQQMVDLMKSYGYADTQKNWFKIFTNKDYTTYPIYSDAGFTTQISCFYSIAPRSHIGIMFNYSAFGEVIGYSSTYGRLEVNLSNISFIPFYTYDLQDFLELKAGPAVMVNSCDKGNYGSQLTDEQYTKYSIGLFTGLNLKIWDRSVTSGKIGINYLLTADTEMGPYTSDTYNTSHMIPESTLNFSHLNFIFAFGLKL